VGVGGLGVGGWAPTPQSPIPNPQSPIPNPHKQIYFLNLFIIKKNILVIIYILKNQIIFEI